MFRFIVATCLIILTLVVAGPILVLFFGVGAVGLSILSAFTGEPTPEEPAPVLPPITVSEDAGYSLKIDAQDFRSLAQRCLTEVRAGTSTDDGACLLVRDAATVIDQRRSSGVYNTSEYDKGIAQTNFIAAQQFLEQAAQIQESRDR